MEVTYLIHATEDQERVGEAVERLLSVSGASELEELEGHFGNPIKRIRVHLTGEEASRGLKGLLSKMPQELKEQLTAEIGKHLDEHSALFLRLSKQSVVAGSLTSGEKDAVRIKVKPRGFFPRGGAAEFYAELLEMP